MKALYLLSQKHYLENEFTETSLDVVSQHAIAAGSTLNATVENLRTSIASKNISHLVILVCF